MNKQARLRWMSQEQLQFGTCDWTLSQKITSSFANVDRGDWTWRDRGLSGSKVEPSSPGASDIVFIGMILKSPCGTET